MVLGCDPCQNQLGPSGLGITDGPATRHVEPQHQLHGLEQRCGKGNWLESAPRMMDTWVDEEIIKEYGRYVQSLMYNDYPLSDFDNEGKVI
jgi:hypothetical protein